VSSVLHLALPDGPCGRLPRLRPAWSFIISPTCLLFFFSSRRRHTRFSRDWSSDVCSSDLATIANEAATQAVALGVVVGAHLPGTGSGQLVIVGLTFHSFQAQGDVALAEGQAEQAAPLVGHAVGAQLHF